MKKIITTAIFASLALALVFLTVNIANAQPAWARGRTRVTVDQAIRRLENQTDAFRREIDRGLDNSRADGTRREDRIETRVAAFENATDELRREFDRRGDTWWETRQNVSRCVTTARDLNRIVRDRRLNNLSRNSWARVQRELNSLARFYGLPRV